MKKLLYLASLAVAVVIGLSASPATTKAEDMHSKLSGRVLLAVQTNGETWYVNPVNQQRYYLGQASDALYMMRYLSLGVSNTNFNSFNGTAPLRLSGRILLKVEDMGKAYYVNPVDLKMHYLGSPTEALRVMQSLSLGVTNRDLGTLTIPEKWTVNIANSSFTPNTLTVRQGAMITWTNNTGTNQTVTSPNNFNFGEIAPGKTYSRMFNDAGTFNYYSLDQRSMTGTIIVK